MEFCFKSMPCGNHIMMPDSFGSGDIIGGKFVVIIGSRRLIRLVHSRKTDFSPEMRQLYLLSYFSPLREAVYPQLWMQHQLNELDCHGWFSRRNDIVLTHSRFGTQFAFLRSKLLEFRCWASPKTINLACLSKLGCAQLPFNLIQVLFFLSTLALKAFLLMYLGMEAQDLVSAF